MKMRVLFFLSGIALFLNQQLYAQSYAETALLFSRTQPGGSARVQALGGTQVSLGGDYSSAFSNPAGLGMFNRSEFSLSLAQKGYMTTTNFFNNKTEESDSKLQVPGLAAVFNVPSGRSDGSFIGGSFAISLNRVNDFNSSMIYSGANTQNSIIQSFINQANGATTAQFDPPSGNNPSGFNYDTPTGLAYYNFLIGPASTLPPDDPNNPNPDDEYFTDVQSNFHPDGYLSDADQREEIYSKGVTNQWSISYGANFSDKIFVGGGIGISTLRYELSKYFQEDYAVDLFFNGLTLEESIRIRGSGINATVGTIFRPLDFMQVGFSYTSPTFYEMTETYEAFMTTSWKNFDYYGDGSEILNNESAGTDVVNGDYNFTIPSKLSLGLTFISKMGFVSGDLEYTNPSKAKYTSDISGVSYAPENEEIQDVFKSVINFRLGAEYRYKIFRLRGGYGIQGRTFVADINNRIHSYSGGAGVRLNNFYVDFALVHRSENEIGYSPYQINESGPNVSRPVVDVTRRNTTGLITIGIMY